MSDNGNDGELSNEAFYDTEIAPKLLELAKLCKERGMSFVANVEYAPDETASTTLLAENPCFKLKLSSWATLCHGNVDALFSAIVKQARKDGHSSMYLHLLKVPTQPEIE